MSPQVARTCCETLRGTTGRRRMGRNGDQNSSQKFNGELGPLGLSLFSPLKLFPTGLREQDFSYTEFKRLLTEAYLFNYEPQR